MKNTQEFFTEDTLNFIFKAVSQLQDRVEALEGLAAEYESERQLEAYEAEQVASITGNIDQFNKTEKELERYFRYVDPSVIVDDGFKKLVAHSAIYQLEKQIEKIKEEAEIA